MSSAFDADFAGVTPMDEKKRAKIMRICRIAAIILALVMIAGLIVEPFFR